MSIFNPFRRRSPVNRSPALNPSSGSALHEALEAAQRAKRAERYAEALEQLNRAQSLAGNDVNAVAVSRVSLGDVLIHQGRWDEATAVLQTARQAAYDGSQRAHLAYVLDMQGVLAQAQGEWEMARSLYEQALETARSVRAIGAEGRALGHLADCYLRENNASYAVHLLRESLPKLNMTGDIELSTYFVGRLGQALIVNGQDGEGRQLIERALRLARQLSYRRYERHWSVVVGEQALAEGRYDDAADHFDFALSLFGEDDTTPQRLAALRGATRAALGARQFAVAEQHARAAVQLAQAVGDEAAQAQAQGTLGAALLADKNYAEAIIALEAAAAYFAQAANPVAEEMDILRDLGAAQAETGQTDAAVATYRRAVQRAEQQGARLAQAQAHRDLGLVYARQRQMSQAVREWSAALAIYEAEKYPAQVARLHCDLAGARKFLGQGQRAMKDYEQALMALNELKDDWETRGLVLSNAATAYVDQGDIESAEAFFNEAIAIARRTGNEAAEATRRGNYGWFLVATGRAQQAIAALQYALQISKTLRLDLQAAIQTDNLGLAQDALGNYPRALEYHQQAIELVRPLDNRHWENVFAANLAQTLLALNRLEEAEPLLEAVTQAGRADDDVEVILRGLIGQGRVALKREQAGLAVALLEEAVSLARKADMRRLLAEALSALSEAQALAGQPERAAMLWDEAQKWLTMLHMPQAKTQPAWMTARLVKP
ncbi:MAG: tetratricopeptide repeat protein [Chloroflexi bacterium]|nr:tetratricopeptide repeat protein [Chloroflexota bacterium]